MERVGFFLIGTAEIGLLITTLVILKRGRKAKVADAVVLAILLTGLVYDNYMLAFGTNIGQGELLRYLSVPRYLFHALFTPTLILFAALSADRMDIPGFRNRERLTLFGAITFFAIWYGLVQDGLSLTLTPTLKHGLLSYKNTGASGPPLAVITTVLCLFVIGGAMQRYGRWPWLFAGSMVMFVIAAFYTDNGLLSNIGELVLLSSMVATAWVALARYTAAKAARREEALAARRQRRQPATASL